MYRKENTEVKKRKAKIKSKKDDKKDKIKHTVQVIKNKFTKMEKKKNPNTEFKQELYIKNAKRLTVNAAY
jgi:hypothetical protein